MRRVNDAQLAGLDLSGWETAVNGGEPIAPGHARAFAERFAPAGLRPEALTPCYGLAEATLLVSGAPPGTERRERPSTPPPWKPMSCGPPPRRAPRPPAHALRGAADGELRIVDPATWAPLPDGRIGEIWVRGESVGPGYWAAPPRPPRPSTAASAAAAAAICAPATSAPCEDGLLHVTGRLKDMIVVAGRNLYPQDLETHGRSRSAASSAPAPPSRCPAQPRTRSSSYRSCEPAAATTSTSPGSRRRPQRLSEEYEVRTARCCSYGPARSAGPRAARWNGRRMRRLFLRGELTPLHQRIEPEVEQLLAAGAGDDARQRTGSTPWSWRSAPSTTPRNPLGQAALLAADAAGEVLPRPSRCSTTSASTPSSCPPTWAAGWSGWTSSGRVLRPVFRRDASLGFGYGLNCFFATTPVWTAGDDEQRRSPPGCS